MNTTMISFLKACTEFFGLAPNQRPLDFGKEIMALTNEDRREIADGLMKAGYNIDPNTIVKK